MYRSVVTCMHINTYLQIIFATVMLLFQSCTSQKFEYKCSMEYSALFLSPILSPASSGLHHIHWLQHFLPLHDWCYHTLLVLEVGFL